MDEQPLKQQPRARLEIVLAEDEHAELIAAFIRQVWDPHATAESVLAARRADAEANVAEPGLAPPTAIAIQGERVLGYVTTLPIRFWDGEHERPAYWIKGLMVLPEFRGGPVGFSIMKKLVERVPLSGGLAVAAPARRLFEALGYKDLGAVPNWIRPLRPGRMLREIDLAALGPALPKSAAHVLQFSRKTGLAAIAGSVAGNGLRLAAAAGRLSARALKAAVFDPAAKPASIDSLWRTVRASLRSSVVRDAAYLLNRYARDAMGTYAWIGVKEKGELKGLLVLRKPGDVTDARLGATRVAVVADALYPPTRPELALALLGEAERVARSWDADAILAMTSAASLGTALRRQCYVRLSGNVHLLLRQPKDEARTLSTALDEWWLTRGDGNADEMF
ncbi:MAG TPA: GNAT family N-acetyltransferase [Steroidobacteraceae bacterium]